MPKHRVPRRGALAGALLASPLLLLAAVPSPAQAPVAGAATDLGTVTVTGTGHVQVAPDMAEIALRVRARDKAMDAALREFRAKRTLFDKVLADFADLGSTARSLGVTLGPKDESQNVVRFNGEEPAAAPFEAREVLEVRFATGDDMDAALDHLAELVAAMAEVDCDIDAPDPGSRVVYSGRDEEKVGPIRFIVSEERLEAARREATELAMADARRQAEHLAVLAGRRIGPVRTVSVRRSFEGDLAASTGADRTVELVVGFSFTD